MTSFLLVILPSIICVLTAAILAYKRIEGWGWFLFIAVLLFLFAGGFKVDLK